nr:hypothetical protein [Moritella viscosa]SHO15510.1 Glycine betaine transporter OpuD [Moritella viscosa]
MDFIIFSLSTSPIVSIITFIMVLLLIASLYGIKNARNSKIKEAIKYNQPEPTERKISEYKEFLKKTSAYLFLWISLLSLFLSFFYSRDQRKKERIELERYETNDMKEV